MTRFQELLIETLRKSSFAFTANDKRQVEIDSFLSFKQVIYLSLKH